MTIMTAAKLAMLLVFTLLPLGSSMAAEVVDAPEEIIVTGRLPGPPLWEIRHQGNTLWLFADISPMPAKFEWDSSYVERVIAGAEEFLSKPTLDMDIGATGFFAVRRIGKLQQLR